MPVKINGNTLKHIIISAVITIEKPELWQIIYITTEKQLTI